MKTFLIDVGSTFVKYAVYHGGTQNFSEIEKTEFTKSAMRQGRRFVAPERELRGLFFALFDKAADMGCTRAFVSVQMHGYLLRTGDAFSDYVSWRDKTGNTADPRLKSIDFYARGTALKDNLPIAKLCNPANSPEQPAEFYTLGSYLTCLLTGRNATHPTDACASGFYRADTLSGDPAPFDSLVLPQVCGAVQWVGSYRGMGIYAPVGDHQASFLGSGAGDDKYLLNIGTATQISCLADKDFPAGPYESRPYFDPERRLVTVSGLLGGAELFAGGDSELLWQQIENALNRLPPKRGVLLGGGGSALFDTLRERLEKTGLSCAMAKENIGLDGLRILAEENRVKRGTMLSEVAFANFPILLKNNGLDFLLIDNEHGNFDHAAISALLMNARLTDVPAIVRLSDNRRENITKLADAGASGFLLPMTDRAEDIAQVVAYAKYAPIGRRGVSTMRAHTLYNPPELKQYMEQANLAMRVFAQIETAQGVENLREILAVPGVDGVMVGPNDLSVDLNCIGDPTPVFPCIEKAAAEAQRAGKVWGIITSNRKLIDFALSHHADMVSYGSELNMLHEGCKNIKEMV